MTPDADIRRSLRAQVAACTRILNMEGLVDYSGHVSARLPDGSGIVIQCYDDPRSRVAPGDLLVCDMAGRIVEGPAGKAPPREVFIHTEILAARPDVDAVGHFHPEIATVFSVLENAPLAAVKNHAARWAGGIPVHPDPGHINSPETGRALAATLGSCNAALIRAHGVVLAAESVPALLVDSVHFEENAKAFWRAAAVGSVNPLSDEELEAFGRRFDRAKHVAKLWKYYVDRAVERGVVPPEWLGYTQSGQSGGWSG